MMMSFSELALASDSVPTTRIQDLVLELPSGWTVVQEAFDAGTGLFVFETRDVVLTMYVRPGEHPSPQQFLVNGATVVSDPMRVAFNGHAWTVMETKKSARQGSVVPSQSVFGFFGKYEGNAYYGYARSASDGAARSAAIEFLNSLN
jgi:hypothetical protein